MVGLSENKANSAQLGLGLAELGNVHHAERNSCGSLWSNGLSTGDSCLLENLASKYFHGNSIHVNNGYFSHPFLCWHGLKLHWISE